MKLLLSLFSIVLLLAANSLIAAPDQPARIKAVLNGDSLKITGTVPSEDLKTTVENDLSDRLPRSVKISNELKVAPSEIMEPSWSDDIAPFMGKFFSAKPSSAEIEIDPATLRLKRSFPSAEIKSNWINRGHILMPEDAKVIDELVVDEEMPAYPAHILAVLRDGDLTLTGQVPTDEFKLDVVAEVSRRSPSVGITNNLIVDPENVQNPEWVNGFGPLMGDFFASNPESAELEISARTLRLYRELPSSEAKSNWINRGYVMMPDNAKVIDQLIVVAPAEIPSTTTTTTETKPTDPAHILATLRNSKLNLTGHVPSEALKTALSRTVSRRAPSIDITNNLTVDPALIQTPEWSNEVAPLLGDFFATNPESAEFEISPTTLRLYRDLPTPEAKSNWINRGYVMMPNGAKVIDQLAVVPVTVEETSPAVSTAPMTTTANEPADPTHVLATLRDSALTITGRVPNEDLKTAISQQITRQSSGKIAITNNLEVDPATIQAPAWSGTEIASVMGNFFGANPGTAEFEISPMSLRLFREVLSAEAKSNWINRGYVIMPDGAKVVDQLVVAAPAPATVQPPAPMTTTKPESKPTDSVHILAVLRDSALTLTGQVPTTELKETISQQVASQSSGKITITNNLEADPARVMTPEWSGREIASVLGNFFATNPPSAEFEISPTTLRLYREMQSAEAKSNWINRAHVIMPDDAKVIDQLAVPTPPAPAPVTTPSKPAAPKAIEKFVVYFDTNVDWVDWEAQKVLIGAAEKLSKLDTSKSIQVKGFADSTGDAAINEAISKRRANSVVNFLVSKGINSNKIKLLGVGASESSDTGDSREDRRVEVTIVE